MCISSWKERIAAAALDSEVNHTAPHGIDFPSLSIISREFLSQVHKGCLYFFDYYYCRMLLYDHHLGRESEYSADSCFKNPTMVRSYDLYTQQQPEAIWWILNLIYFKK